MMWRRKVDQGGGIGGKVNDGEYAPTLADWMMYEQES